ncbi:hypothetical protein JCM10450v2_005000 [Rhodotorula kratochvilovae]
MTSQMIDRFATRACEHASPSLSPPPPPPSSGNLGMGEGGVVGLNSAAQDDCAFCEIAAGQEPAHKVYEDEHALAFLDILPIRRGHLLLIPKRHYERIPRLPDNLSAHLGRVLPRLSRALCRATGQPDFNIVSNQGYAQVVPHAHFHLVPAPSLSSAPSASTSSTSIPSQPFTMRRSLGREELDDVEGAQLAQRIREELEKEADDGSTVGARLKAKL